MRHDISLKELNSFGIEARADRFAECSSTDELRRMVVEARGLPGPLLVLGGGSNILFTGDFKGTVLHPAMKSIAITGESGGKVSVRAEAGIPWDDLVAFSIANGLGGIENLSGIPGSSGAAPIQNIGAYGTELSDTLQMVEGIDMDGNSVKFQAAECKAGYRDSIFKNELKGKVIITAITLGLAADPLFNLDYADLRERVEAAGPATLSAVRQTVLDIRAAKLPDPALKGNAGSFFKNPVVDHELYIKIRKVHGDLPSYPAGEGRVKIPAAWLIDRCGLKGYRKGDAGVHDKQPLVLVNHGNASGKEIFDLSVEIISIVSGRFGIELSREVNVI